MLVKTSDACCVQERRSCGSTYFRTGRRQPLQSRSPLALFLKRVLLRSALTAEEQAAILQLTGESQRFAAHRDVVSPGECVRQACLVAEGIVGRFDQMVDGQRQTTSYYIPGDMCDLHSVVAPRASWSITAVSPSIVMRISHVQLTELCIRYPAITMAFWRDQTVDSSVFAKWVGNLGRKSAKARIAHLICEMGVRIEAAGLGSKTSFDLNVTQVQLADAAGITSVHANRTLQELRGEGLLIFGSGHVEVPDWEMLAEVAEFDPAYLMLDELPQRVIPPSSNRQPAAAR